MRTYGFYGVPESFLAVLGCVLEQSRRHPSSLYRLRTHVGPSPQARPGLCMSPVRRMWQMNMAIYSEKKKTKNHFNSLSTSDKYLIQQHRYRGRPATTATQSDQAMCCWLHNIEITT